MNDVDGAVTSYNSEALDKYYTSSFLSVSFFPARRWLARLLAAVVCFSVCLSVRPYVTSRYSTETAKRSITRTTPHDSPRILVFCHPKSRQNSNGVTLNGGSKCRWGRLNACAVAYNWRLSTRSVVNLARWQVYHTERPPYLFAARSPSYSASRGFVSDS